jgi:hypothetical protein
MNFLIAETFTASFNRLSGMDQKAAKASVFDLQMDRTGNGLQLHRIDKSKDSNFWSARVNRDIRLIVHKTDESLLVAYVDHPDAAYAWAERRRIEAHPAPARSRSSKFASWWRISRQQRLILSFWSLPPRTRKSPRRRSFRR